METETKPKSPRPGKIKKRRTCLNLDDFLWSKLKDVERKTGATPSVTARRILSEAFGVRQEA